MLQSYGSMQQILTVQFVWIIL